MRAALAREGICRAPSSDFFTKIVLTFLSCARLPSFEKQATIAEDENENEGEDENENEGEDENENEGEDENENEGEDENENESEDENEDEREDEK
jgi:cobalamin biosynthesis protein CobT